MLGRLLARLAVLAMAAVGAMVVASPAHADYVYCPPSGGDCYIVVTTPGGGGDGGGGGGGGGGGSYVCSDKEAQWGCHDELYGWYNPSDRCYWLKLTGADMPPASDPVWNGHHPDGAIYKVWCANTVGFPSTGNTWRGSNPPGYGGMPAPLVLATQAINRLGLTGPDIQIRPEPTGAGLVGLPVWLWTPVTPTTWGPNSATASVPGLSVTATARAQRIVWAMGDGNQVTCANPGTAYEQSLGSTMSPTCGYRYAQPSRTEPGGRYPITATTTWTVTWASSNGQSGSLTVDRVSTTSIRIDELQVVTR